MRRGLGGGVSDRGRSPSGGVSGEGERVSARAAGGGRGRAPRRSAGVCPRGRRAAQSRPRLSPRARSPLSPRLRSAAARCVKAARGWRSRLAALGLRAGPAESEPGSRLGPQAAGAAGQSPTPGRAEVGARIRLHPRPGIRYVVSSGPGKVAGQAGKGGAPDRGPSRASALSPRVCLGDPGA